MKGTQMNTTPPHLRVDPSARIVRLRLGKDRVVKTQITIVLLWSVTVLLTGFGLMMVLSASSITSYLEDQTFLGGFWRQALYAGIGLPLMAVASRIPLRLWKALAWWAFGIALVLQALVFTPLGVVVGGNRNWIELGPIRGQPSEFLKLALIIWMGAVLLAKEKLLGQSIHVIIPAVFPGAAGALLLVLVGGDLGTALVMFAIVFGVLYFAQLNWRAILTVVLASAVVAVLLVLTSENRMRRVMGLLSSEEDYSGHDWQPLHGIWALAAGGIFGAGAGASKTKWSWLPAADNDYIFAIIGEEFGLIGATFTLLLYLVLAIAMLRVMAVARDRFGRAVVGGIMVWIIGQALLNIGVVLRMFPVIGVPLPLISAGGTALISCLVAMGVVISIARDGFAYREELRIVREGREG